MVVINPNNIQLPSVDPSHLSGNGVDTALAAGAPGGIEWKLLTGVRLGVAGSTRMSSMAFADYRGLLAGGGDFDIPANLQAGIAVDLLPTLTLMADYKRISYGSVAALHNVNGPLFGAPDGPGFGWSNVDFQGRSRVAGVRDP